MGDFIEAAASIFAQAQSRVELSGQNLANMTTYGYKRRVGFQQALGEVTVGPAPEAAIDFAAGQIVKTGGALDLALLGDGFLMLAGPSGALLTRQGQFTRDADGRLVNGEGLPLLLTSGRELTVRSNDIQVLEDGTVMDGGEPVGVLAVNRVTDQTKLSAAGPGVFTAPAELLEESRETSIRQGFLEASNVSSADEMVAMMEALRRAGAAQRLVGVYDDLMGKAISGFGQ
jgi:flagellar basal-body rod protein FlgF